MSEELPRLSSHEIRLTELQDYFDSMLQIKTGVDTSNDQIKKVFSENPRTGSVCIVITENFDVWISHATHKTTIDSNGLSQPFVFAYTMKRGEENRYEVFYGSKKKDYQEVFPASLWGGAKHTRNNSND